MKTIKIVLALSMLATMLVFAKDKGEKVCTNFPRSSEMLCKQDNGKGKIKYTSALNLGGNRLIFDQITEEEYNHKFAFDKELEPYVPPANRVYGLTGLVWFDANRSDYSASVTVDGQTYSSYCTFTESSASCSDSGGSFTVALADGRHAYLPTSEDPKHSNDYPGLGMMPTRGDFKYRISDDGLYCLPQGEKAESCYKLYFKDSPASATAGESLSELPEAIKKPLLENSEAMKTSPAAAAQLAQDGHVTTPQEMAQLVQDGQASKTAVITVPAGADVYVDGNKLGVTPVAFVLIKRENPRTVTVKMAGYKTVEKTLAPDGKNIPIAITLEKEAR